MEGSTNWHKYSILINANTHPRCVLALLPLLLHLLHLLCQQWPISIWKALVVVLWCTWCTHLSWLEQELLRVHQEMLNLFKEWHESIFVDDYKSLHKTECAKSSQQSPWNMEDLHDFHPKPANRCALSSTGPRCCSVETAGNELIAKSRKSICGAPSRVKRHGPPAAANMTEASATNANIIICNKHLQTFPGHAAVHQRS